MGLEDLLAGGERGCEKVCKSGVLVRLSLLHPHFANKLPHVCEFLKKARRSSHVAGESSGSIAGGVSNSAHSGKDSLCACDNIADNCVTETGYDLNGDKFFETVFICLKYDACTLEFSIAMFPDWVADFPQLIKMVTNILLIKKNRPLHKFQK